MTKNAYLNVTKVKKSLEIGNADKVEKIIIRVKTENPEMLEVSIFDNLLEKVDFQIAQTGVKDDSWAREADNLHGYTEVNYTPTHIFEITNIEVDYEVNLYYNFENADIEIVEKEVKEEKEIVLDKKFVKNIDGDEYEMNLQVIKTKNGLEGYLTSNPSGVNLEAYGKADIISYFHDDYLPDEAIKELKETLKEF